MRTRRRQVSQVNRVSHEGEYEVDGANRPLNPWGRTGLQGRGLLGRSTNES